MKVALPGKPGAARDAPQQQALYSQAFRDVAAHVEADDAFSKVKGAVEGYLGLLQKQAQVRVRNWLKKLSEETANVVWKKNRNAYAKLLLEQLRQGKLAEPFNSQPPDGPLPTLPKHMAYAFKPPRASSPAAGAPAPSVFAVAATAAGQSSPTHQQQQQQQQLNATEQLDEYLGRSGFRRAAEPAIPAAPAASVHQRGSAATTSSGEPQQHLPGTRMQLRGAEGRRVDRHQLNDAGWQPSKLELQAELGASRERQAELEWRLQQLEGVLGQQGVSLPQALELQAAPLGSLLDALEDSYVSPQRKKAGKKELEELIERFEAKRQRWRAQSAPCQQQPSRATRQPVDERSDDAEILQQLDNFQRQTESIRRAMCSAPGCGADDGVSITVQPSDWGLPVGTPLRQHPTGLRGSGYTPGPEGGGRPGGQQRAVELFDGLPLSPAALAASRWGAHNRHAEHAGHLDHATVHQVSMTQQRQDLQIARPQTADAGIGSRRAAASEQQQRIRSPIGPDIRHTKKSAAAAAERANAAAGAALQRLKSMRQPSPVPGSAAEPAQQPGAASSRQQDGVGGQQEPKHTTAAQTAPLEDWRQAPAGQHQQIEQLAPTQSPDAGNFQGAASRQQPQDAALAPAPELPPDSNAALVAEVRQLRTKLLASLQKHAPEAATTSIIPRVNGGSLLSSKRGGNLAASSLLDHRHDMLQSDSLDGSRQSEVWQLPAVPRAVSPSASAVSRPVRLEGILSGSSSPWPAPGSVAASSGKYRLTDLGSSGAVSSLTDEVSALLLNHRDAATPSSLAGGGGSLARLSSWDVGGGVSPAASQFSLDMFEEHTEALRRQLARL